VLGSFFATLVAVPVKPLAGSVVKIQPNAGMLYLAVAVSRIVGLTLGRARRQS
jgi:hypothetical protein